MMDDLPITVSSRPESRFFNVILLSGYPPSEDTPAGVYLELSLRYLADFILSESEWTRYDKLRIGGYDNVNRYISDKH